MARPRKNASKPVAEAAKGTTPAPTKAAEQPEAEGDTATTARFCPVTGAPVRGKSAFAGPGSDAKAKSLLNKMLAAEDVDALDQDIADTLAGMAHPGMFREAYDALVEAEIEKVLRPTPAFHPDQDIDGCAPASE